MTDRPRDAGESAPTVPLANERPAAAGPGELALRIVGAQGLFATHALPSTGEIVFGRGGDADVRIDDPSISRKHARLLLGPEGMRVEDLGSVNGTRVRDLALVPGAPVDVRPGDVVDLGSVMVLVQARWPRSPRADAPVVAPSAVQHGNAMQDLYRLIDRVAAGTISVLLLGETGAGKEVLAEAIHKRSPRAAQPYLKLNCAALSASLLESELFGHEKGAFTGAVAAKPGLLESAEGGTVFLDEIGELPIEQQVKLLRVLEERKVLRVGSVKPRPIDVRFIAATNRDLDAEIARGAFRQDLYFRVNGMTLLVPPLRERTGEIEGLAKSFLAEASTKSGRGAPPALSGDALRLLEAMPWPGNVRELRNVIERALLLSGGDEIRPEHLAVAKQPRQGAAPLASPPGTPLKGEVEALEKQRILEALEACAGNQTRAAKMLGLSRNTLLARLDAFGIPRPRK